MRPGTPLVLLALLIPASHPTAADPAEMRIVAPSAAGTGWDQLAHLLRDAMVDEHGATGAEVVNVPGSGGTAGLTRFAAEASGLDLLVTGLTMVDAALLNRSPVMPKGLTPIARLGSEPFAIVVPAASELTTIEELRAAILADPAKVTWAGGPSGGLDNVAAILFGRAIGLNPLRLSYAQFLASPDAVAALAENQVAAIIAPLGEVAAGVKAGRLRILAVTTRQRVEGLDAPTLLERGIPLELTNWRGVLARAGLPPAQREALAARIEQLTASPLWQSLLTQRGWVGDVLTGPAFESFLRGEEARVKEALKSVGLLKAARN